MKQERKETREGGREEEKRDEQKHWTVQSRMQTVIKENREKYKLFYSQSGDKDTCLKGTVKYISQRYIT